MNNNTVVSFPEKGCLLGAIEGGGTKFVCAVGEGPSQIIDETRISTREPEETLAEIISFFSKHPIVALGIGMFGPLELRRGPEEGSILKTPKPGWAHFPFRQVLEKQIHVPIAIDTDVNAAALGEARWGAAQGDSVVLYVTVGTGVGGGVLINGRPLHGLMHAEFGHLAMPILRDEAGKLDDFDGSCPYHGRCLEGLISGPALLRRTGTKGEMLDPEHSAFAWAARYLGVGLASAVLMLSPERIIIGGSVMARSELLSKVRQGLLASLAGYVSREELTVEGVERYVVAPGLQTRSGIAGAFALAEQALANANHVGIPLQ
jgi:fructokinase